MQQSSRQPIYHLKGLIQIVLSSVCYSFSLYMYIYEVLEYTVLKFKSVLFSFFNKFKCNIRRLPARKVCFEFEGPRPTGFEHKL